jgi:hypothetical protein
MRIGTPRERERLCKRQALLSKREPSDMRLSALDELIFSRTSQGGALRQRSPAHRSFGRDDSRALSNRPEAAPCIGGASW